MAAGRAVEAAHVGVGGQSAALPWAVQLPFAVQQQQHALLVGVAAQRAAAAVPAARPQCVDQALPGQPSLQVVGPVDGLVEERLEEKAKALSDSPVLQGRVPFGDVCYCIWLYWHLVPSTSTQALIISRYTSL